MRIPRKMLIKLNDEQLKQLIEEVNAIVKARAVVASARASIEGVLSKAGIKFADVAGSVGRGKRVAKKALPGKRRKARQSAHTRSNGRAHGKKVAAKWYHKEDKKLTWSGRGRTPLWIKSHGIAIEA